MSLTGASLEGKKENLFLKLCHIMKCIHLQIIVKDSSLPQKNVGFTRLSSNVIGRGLHVVPSHSFYFSSLHRYIISTFLNVYLF